MLYIGLVSGASIESEEVAPGVALEFDVHNRLLGIEVEHRSKTLDLSRLEVLALPIIGLVLRERAPVKS
jgi:uncharacterized protein YuzE